MKGNKHLAPQKRKKTGMTRLYGLLILLAVGIAIGGIYAKYYYEGEDGAGTVRARWFYFTSDRLSTVDSVTPIMTTGETASVTFELRNYKSDMEWTENDLTCTVTVAAEGESVPDSANDELVVSYDPKDSIDGGSKGSITVTVSGMKVGYTYQITATGKAGYVETLRASFQIVNKQAVYKSLSIEGTRVLLTVRTENVKGDAVLDIPAGLIPNKTETKIALDALNNYKGGSYVEEPGYTDAYSFNTLTNTSQVYSFLKDNPSADYNLDSFGIITVGDVKAVEE